MREVNLVQDLQVVAPAHRHGRGAPLSHAVHRQHRCFLERGREKRAGGVAEVVFREEQLAAPVQLAMGFQFVLEQVPQKQFLLQPKRRRNPRDRKRAVEEPQGPDPTRTPPTGQPTFIGRTSRLCVTT